MTSEQVDEFMELLLETGDLFLRGCFPEARRLYKLFFDFLDRNENAIYPLSHLDIMEARARYCRSVYEDSDQEKRLEEFLESMRILPLGGPSFRKDECESRPLLQDVMDSATQTFHDLESFFPQWEGRLSDFSSPRAAMLRLEAVEWLEGIGGVSRLAREWGSREPCGYLHWIRLLERRGEFSKIPVICEEALAKLPPGKHRRIVAESLIKAGGRIGDDGLVLKGRRECFLSSPDVEHLMELVAEAKKQGCRSQELGALLPLLRPTGSGHDTADSLRLRVHLMNGSFEEALLENRDKERAAWSYDDLGLLFAAALSVLTDHSSAFPTIQELLKQFTAGKGYRFTFHGPERTKSDERVYEEIRAGLRDVKISRQRKSELLEWAENVGRRRIESVVSS